MERDRGPAGDGAKDMTKDIEKQRDRLVAALRLKLTELDARVAAYRRDRADEFRRYAVDLIGPLSDEAVTAITTAIEGPAATPAATYPALYPGFVEDGAKKASSMLSAPPARPPARPPRRSASPPPVLYHTSGTPKEGPRRPNTFFLADGSAPSPLLHARDNDFRGVFTPPFLPLLDSWSYDRRSGDNNGEAAAPAKAAGADAPKADEGKTVDGVAAPFADANANASANAASEPTEAAAAAVEKPAEPVVEVPPPPQPKLKSVLRRTSSISSSRSSTRSSTPVNTSPSGPPRHVRFSFNGEEVLPTASPPREQLDEQDLSWLMHDNSHSHNHSSNGTPGHSVYDYSRHYQAAAMLPGSKEAEAAVATSSTADPASVILDDDDDGEFVPLARKVSSSDRLRALSKMPLEDPSNWTVVNPQADTQSPATEQLTPADLVYQPPPQAPLAPSPPEVEQREYANPNESDVSSSDDEDGFVMRATRKTTSPPQSAAAVPPPALAPAPATNSPSLDESRPKHGTSHTPIQIIMADSPLKNGASRKKKAHAADDDDFFGFEPDDMNGEVDDDDDVGYPLSRVTDVNTFDKNDEEEPLDNIDNDDNVHDEDPVQDAALVEKEKATLGIGTDGLDSHDLVFNRKSNTKSPEENDSNLSASLLTRLRKVQSDSLGDNIVQGSGSFGAQQPPSSPPAISAGSYRGKSIDLFNVVKDPRILQQAAQMGNLNSFVGSVHDRNHEIHAPASLADFSSLSGREQLNLLSGTPRSLTERMVMEDTRKIFSPPR
ncbi:negative regulator of the PHO system [Sporothrix curviconia]|uniref:Negative regulator of the PHO system n=1 Tax=Sporothrix curviconia TaxID=1260050 RepID=A0ABP0BLJ8_9PEZI